MGPIGHFSVGFAAKAAAPKVPLGILLLATWWLDVLAIALGLAGIERGGNAPWSHGLFMSVVWSVVAALLAARVYRDHRAGVVVGLLVFSHLVRKVPPSKCFRNAELRYLRQAKPVASSTLFRSAATV